MEYQKILEQISKDLEKVPKKGAVASYIPELSKIDPDKLGMHLCSLEGGNFGFGDSEEKFSIQSIAKVLTLTLAFEMHGDQLWQRVGVEPSGSPFNSLVQLEHEHGIPRNPLINSGALVICDILMSSLNNPKEELLAFVRKIARNGAIQYNRRIAESEKSHGYRNAALVNMMKSFGNIQNDVGALLDFYFYTCSLEMTCSELANTFLLYANKGRLFGSGETIISGSKTKRINAIMQTCGFYDEAGEFTFRVGLPGKSGVGGGIAAVNPGHYSVAVWSPRLNKKGNSFLGMQILEELTTLTESSIF